MHMLGGTWHIIRAERRVECLGCQQRVSTIVEHVNSKKRQKMIIFSCCNVLVETLEQLLDP